MERSLGIRYRVKEVLSADKFSYDTVRRGETKEKSTEPSLDAFSAKTAPFKKADKNDYSAIIAEFKENVNG